jgi:hypothetical protein
MTEQTNTVDSCVCSTCRRACSHKPGWFEPGEVAALAEAMGLTVKQLFDKHLAVDWWVGDGDDDHVFVISPAIKGEESGSEFPGEPSGECVFFNDQRCIVHDLGKPFECRKTWHGPSDGPRLHKQARDAWDDPAHQQMIRDLLGRDPVASEYEGDGGILGVLLGRFA